MKKTVIILAGGRGSRMNSPVNKVLLTLCGKTVLRRSIDAFIPYVDKMIIVSRQEDQREIRTATDVDSVPVPVCFVSGGETRQESVLNGLRSLDAGPDDIVLIHDAARCLVDAELIKRVIQSVMDCGTGIPGVPASSTYKVCDSDSFVVSTPDRSALYEIQTPQGFTAGRIMEAAVKAAEESFDCTDDAGLLERFHIPVKVVPGSASNIKLTEPEDLSRAKMILKGAELPMRVGMGYDVHRLVTGRKLILCGVEIPYEFGLLGHSDADVALHALMDAMLGACALGDIGRYFPDTEERFRGISSVLLLQYSAEILAGAGYHVANADITIVAQNPKILPYIPDMIRTVSDALNLPENKINIKATTTEELGFEGRLEGISAYAVCSVVEQSEC